MDYFSSRELALVIWIGIGLVFLFLHLRERMKSIFRSLVAKKVAIILLTLIAFTFIAGWLLSKSRFWEHSFVKDTIFWYFGFVMGTFLSLDKAKEVGYFKKLLGDIFKVTLLTEFVLNFYTFNLVTELILFPVIVLLSLTWEFSKRDKKNQDATIVLSFMLACIGLVYFGYALYMTIDAYQDLFTLSNLVSLILPCLLSIIILPVFYLIALLMEYEELFSRTDRMTHFMGAEREARKAVMFAAGLSLRKLGLINQYMDKSDLPHACSLKTYFRNLTLADRQ